MLNITDEASFTRALDSPIAEPIKALLRHRRSQLLADVATSNIGELAQFVIVEPADAIAAIEAAAGYPIITDPAFEWVADHGGLFEAVTILSDDGFGVVLLMPDDPAVDPELLTLLRKQSGRPPIDPTCNLDREVQTLP